jgi:N-acetylneuraminate lyase
MSVLRLQTLVAATHTPFHPDHSLNLDIVERQAAHLLQNGIKTVFIGGTTGESHSLSLAERRALTQRWMEVTAGSNLQVVVHVGGNCLTDVCDLAMQAQSLGALAISALTPSYFKPRTVADLVECCAKIAGAAPDLPFYYYDIPSFTGVNQSMPDFLSQSYERIPNLAGIKFTNPDGMMFQQCLYHESGRYDILWGTDECLLAGLALGARGAVGSTYNFAAPLYQRLVAAFDVGDLEKARVEQRRSVEMIARIAAIGYMGAAKAVMSMLGVDVGPARLPHSNPDANMVNALRHDLEQMDFFDFIRPS